MNRGWAPTPVRPRSKVPLLGAWPRRRLEEGDLQLLADDLNLGLVLGAAGGGLVDVDCDWPEAAALAPLLLPPTGLVHGRAGSRRSHYWYRSAAATAVFRLPEPRVVDGRKSVVVELRSTGLMTVVPPSVHPSGEALAWERWGEPTAVTPAALRHAVGRLATAALLRALDWSINDALAFVRAPELQSLARLERRHGAWLPLRSWLAEAPPRDERSARSRAPCASSALVPGRASQLTEAVLARAGGVVGAARLLELDLRDGRQACPFHPDSGPRSLQVTRHVWRCWASCGGGNAIHLASRALGVSYVDARSWLARRLGVVPFCADPKPHTGTERATLD